MQCPYVKGINSVFVTIKALPDQQFARDMETISACIDWQSSLKQLNQYADKLMELAKIKIDQNGLMAKRAEALFRNALDNAGTQLQQEGAPDVVKQLGIFAQAAYKAWNQSEEQMKQQLPQETIQMLKAGVEQAVDRVYEKLYSQEIQDIINAPQEPTVASRVQDVLQVGVGALKTAYRTGGHTLKPEQKLH